MIHHSLDSYMKTQKIKSATTTNTEPVSFSAVDAVSIKKLKDDSFTPGLFHRLKGVANQKLQNLILCNGYVSGGYFADIFNYSIPKDIDVYLDNPLHVMEFMNSVTPDDVLSDVEMHKLSGLKAVIGQMTNGKQLKKDSTSFALKLKSGFDVICAFCGEPEKTTAKFDMYQCMSYFKFVDNTFHISPLTYHLIKDRRIMFNVDSEWNIHPDRFIRYLSKGYHYIAPCHEGDLTVHFMKAFNTTTQEVRYKILPMIKHAPWNNETTLVLNYQEDHSDWDIPDTSWTYYR
jgi:hypothetical protein